MTVKPYDLLAPKYTQGRYLLSAWGLVGLLKDISDYCTTPGKPTPAEAAAELSFTKEKLCAYSVSDGESN